MKILVLEDSPLIRKIILNELRTEGFEFEVAGTAEEAMQILETVPNISLITLRVVMEGMNGFDFVAQLNSNEVRNRLKPMNNHMVPTIIVTSNDTDEDRLRGYKVGASDFIQKPWPKGELVEHVNMALGLGTQFSGLSVLVVDDSPTARHFITSCLTPLGVTIYQADDGDTAIEILSDPAVHVDLVVTDLNMERMNGDQLCVKIRGELGMPHLPIIFLSGNEDNTTILSLFKMGATDYLKKPFMKEELIARLRAYLDREDSRQELTSSVAQLQQSNLLKDEFMTVCSQDLYSPMEKILAYVEELTGDIDEQDSRHELAVGVRETGRHLMSLLSSLTDIGRIASGGENMRLISQDWSQILDSSMADHRPLARAKGVKLTNSVSAACSKIRGDRPSLERICNNLISNAVKFTPGGGTITVNLVDGRRGELVLEVTDTGIGIASEMLPSLFDRYKRTSTPGTNGESGAGLGLAITRQLVANNGGTMAVESNPGSGTTVRVIMPLPRGADQDEGLEADSPAAGKSSLQPGEGSRVLIVDGEPGNLARGRNLLLKLGCKVSEAVSGPEAVTAFKKAHGTKPFDLVIMDLDLPIQSGLETARAIRQAESAETRDQVPILAMTATSLGGKMGDLVAAGINDFLAKPLATQSVKEALERWLPVLA